jgi:hypothetical protein
LVVRIKIRKRKSLMIIDPLAYKIKPPAWRLYFVY